MRRSVADAVDNVRSLPPEYEGLLDVDERLVNGLVQATRASAQVLSE